MCNEIAARRQHCVNRLHRTFRYYRFLLAISWKFRFIPENADAMKYGLETFHLIDTSRCKFSRNRDSF